MKYKLGDIVKEIIDYRGKTPKKLGFSWSESGIRAFSAKNIKTGQIVQPESIRYISEENYPKWMKQEVERGTILITSEAPFGQIFYWNSDEKIVLSQRLFAIKIKDEFDSEFVYYQMTSDRFQSELKARATGSTVTGLRQPELMKCEIDLPDLKTQKKIVRILSALDQKIELNHQQNSTIEKQASALVQKYIYDEKCIAKLKEIMSFDNGFAFKSKDYVDPGKYKVITIKNVQDGLIDSSSAQFVADYPRDMRDCHKLSVGDVLLSLTGNVGRVGIVFEKNLLLNQRVAKVKPKDESLLPFLYFFFRKNDFKQKLEALAKGTAQLNLSPVETLNEKIAYSEQSAFELSNRLKPFFEKIILNNQDNKTLSSIRDSLLPKLMSGEINLENMSE